MTTAFGIAFLVVAVGLLIAGFISKALYAVIATFIGSFGLALLFDGYAMYLFWTGVIALVALLLSKAAARIVVIVGVILTLFVGAPFGLSMPDWFDDKKSDTTASDDAFVQRTPDECVDKYNVVFDKNVGNRLDSDGAFGTPNQVREQFLKNGQHDPRVLQLAVNASPLGKVTPVNDWKELVDNGCYNEKARDLFQQTRGVYLAAKVEPAMAPSNGINTGVTPRGSGFQEQGVSGTDRESTRVTFQNGDVIYIMHRCGNIVTTKPIPKVPPKPQPEPEQPKPTPDRPKPTCPDGKPFNPDGTCPKDPSKDVNNNPAVPDPVKGPGTTPVGTDPGPATPVYDSPTGCNGPCPRPSDQPAPRPVATERPQGDPNGGSGNGGATPGPGPTDDSDSGQTTAPQPERDDERPPEGTTGTPPPDGPQDCGTGNPDDC